MITLVRKGMKDVLGIKRVQLYHEEKINNPHIHFWLLPLWPDIMEINNIFPKIYEGNVKQYIDLFRFTDTKDEIIKNNKLMKEYLENFSQKLLTKHFLDYYHKIIKIILKFLEKG